MHRELLKTQQQSRAFFVESIEKEISTNSELAQSLLEQPSGAASGSLQEQVGGLIAKERENASKLWALEEIENETMAIAEEQQCFIEAQLRLPTPRTSAVESALEADNYGRARPKTTQRVTIRSPQVKAVPASNVRQDKEIGMLAALLKDEVFNIVPGTANVTQGMPWTKQVDSNKENEIYNSQRLPQVLDTLVAGWGVYSATFKKPVSPTPWVRLHPTAVDLSGDSSPETLNKDTEDKVFRHNQPWVKSYKGGGNAKNYLPYIKSQTGEVHSG